LADLETVLNAQQVPRSYIADPGFDNAEGCSLSWYDNNHKELADQQKLYLYANILKGGPNYSRKRIVWTNWVCGIILVGALIAAICALKSGL
jgi:hypothetical protein